MPDTQLQFDTLPGLRSQLPRLFATLLRPGWIEEDWPLQTIEARCAPLKVNFEQLAHYQSVCGFKQSQTLPITFPHVMASALHTAIVVHKEFPLRALGLVHTANFIRQTRPIQAGEVLEFRCRLNAMHRNDKGREFDLLTDVNSNGEAIWQETTRFLVRDPQARKSSRGSSAQEAGGVEIDAADDIGRRYAKVSGDMNPIHLWSWSARLFGFKRAIAHGMWTLARTAVELEKINQQALCELDGVFKTPVFLPGSLQLHADAASKEYQLMDGKDGRPKLLGRFR